MSDDDQNRVPDNCGNYRRLVEIKRDVDPDNLFQNDQNIKP